jgi:Cu/Zn superoxide dismutase
MGAKRTKWATTAVIVVAMLAGTAGVAAAAWKIKANDWLTDLSTTTTDGTENARAQVVAEAEGGSSTRVALKLEGLDHLQVGRTYGAHVHVGPCQAGNGAAAGPHYNHGGGISPQTEIWLDFTVEQGGVARSETVVPFLIADGAAQSVVIHALATNPATGLAGARVACIPVAF